MITKRKGPRQFGRLRRLMTKTATIKFPDRRPTPSGDGKIGRIVIVTHDIRCNGLLITEGQLAIITQVQRDWYTIVLDPGYPGWDVYTPAFLTNKDCRFAGKKIQIEMKDRVINAVSAAVDDNLKAMQLIGAIYGKKEKLKGRSKKKA